MKNLIYALAALLLALLAAPCVPSARGQELPPPPPAAGGYTTYLGAQQFGTETYSVTTSADGTRRAVGEATFGGTRLKGTTVYGADRRPASFVLEVNGARALGVEFTAQGGRVSPEGQPPRDLKARVDAALENGLWHQFVLLLAQYDAARGGAQAFHALLPSQAIEFNVTVERAGAPSFDVKGQKVQTQQYRVSTDLGLAFDVWTDAERTPLLVSVPAQRLRAVRTGAEELSAVVLPAEGAAAARPKAGADEAFTSEEVVFQNGEQKLAGTLTLPKTGAAPYPAAVLISGSGSQDRDGTGLGDIYRKIAERLSSAGVAVLRVDDRGAGASSMPTRPTSYRDLVADTRAAFEYVAARKEIDPKRVALVGHSEGALTALLITSEDTRVAAVAVLAGASRPIDSVLLEQTLYMTALEGTIDPADRAKMPGLSRRLLEMFEQAKASPRPAADAPADNLSWFREHAAADPLATVRRVRVPLLVLNGERDENVLPHHALELASAAVAAGNRNVRLRLFPNLSHLFAPSRLDKTVAPDKYTEVSEEFLRTLQEWATSTLTK